MGTCCPSRTSRGFGPTKRRSKGLCGVGGGQNDHLRNCVKFMPRRRTQTIDRSRKRKLRSPEPLNEIPTAKIASLFECLQDGVDPGEASRDALAECRLSCEYPVPLHELQCERGRALG